MELLILNSCRYSEAERNWIVEKFVTNFLCETYINLRGIINLQGNCNA